MTILQQWRKITDWLLPICCLFCKNPADRFHLCAACFGSLPWLKEVCPVCAKSLRHSGLTCGSCLIQPPPYDSTYALFSYQSPIDHLVLGIKFRQKLVYAKVLGELMTEKLEKIYLENKPDYIIPIPLHPTRIKVRGFNQAVEIAKPIAKKLAIPLDISSAQRILATQPQAAITSGKRQSNVNHAFQVNPLFHANHIALIDDVVTTASTVTALAKCYKKLGVKKIDVWCCAKTIRYEDT